jgi:hypothetical protein
MSFLVHNMSENEIFDKIKQIFFKKKSPKMEGSPKKSPKKSQAPPQRNVAKKMALAIIKAGAKHDLKDAMDGTSDTGMDPTAVAGDSAGYTGGDNSGGYTSYGGDSSGAGAYSSPGDNSGGYPSYGGDSGGGYSGGGDSGAGGYSGGGDSGAGGGYSGGGDSGGGYSGNNN